MTTIDQPATPTAVDEEKLMSFVFRAVGEVAASLNNALVVMGDQLGYYDSLATNGASTPAELAERTDTDVHYTREWLNAQAAGDFVTYDPSTGRYTLPPEQATALTDESSPVYLQGLFQTAYGSVHSTARIIEAARTGDGLGWHEQTPDVHVGCERFFKPSYQAHLVADWLPSLDGVVSKLESGTSVVDIGCGHGASTIVMATAFPNSQFIGVDYHDASIRTATQRAADAGVAERARFHTGKATAAPGSGYGLVTMFDCLHDMGDPVGAAKHVREAIADDGTWMIVEPAAGDHVEDNLNPVGRAYYGFSTLLCTPNSLSQDVGLALGTQAGPAKIRDVITTA
ncbi:MAG: class I SAM-dependent methyltransferase, partial [Actinomycetia bacterium]|nr:class I SAM-dependent methyltransferase [Actinomycetes bacterium]